MTTYINLKTGQYPFHVGDLSLLGFDKNNLNDEWAEILQDDYPLLNKDEIAELNDPIELEGSWHRSWTIRKMTENEIEAAQHEAALELSKKGDK